MICQRCKHKAEIHYLSNHLCKSCFTRLIEKRIRKYLRIQKLIKNNDNLLIVGELCQDIISRILKDLPIKVYKAADTTNYLNNKALKAKAKKLKAKIIIPWSMDHESHYFIKNFIEKKKQTYLGQKKPFIKLLNTITDQEAQLLAKIKKVKYKPLKQDHYTKMFSTLEQKYKSVRYAFAGAVQEFSKVFQK